MLRSIASQTCALPPLIAQRCGRHTTGVAADPLFEAAVLAIQILKRDGWITGSIGNETTLESPSTRDSRFSHGPLCGCQRGFCIDFLMGPLGIEPGTP